MEENNSLRKQYEQAWDVLNQESTRFWTRFNISLIINTGLIVGFSTMLGFSDTSQLVGTLGVFAISVMGLFFSVMWIRITNLSREWQNHYADKVKAIEDELVKNNLIKNEHRITAEKGKISGSVTKTAIKYPKVFFIFWFVLTQIFGVYQILQLLT